MTELAEEILGIPVRRGVPKGVGGLAEVVDDAPFATGVGLVQYGVKNLGITHFARGDADSRSVWQRMRSWFGEVFKPKTKRLRSVRFLFPERQRVTPLVRKIPHCIDAAHLARVRLRSALA